MLGVARAVGGKTDAVAVGGPVAGILIASGATRCILLNVASLDCCFQRAACCKSSLVLLLLLCWMACRCLACPVCVISRAVREAARISERARTVAQNRGLDYFEGEAGHMIGPPPELFMLEQ